MSECSHPVIVFNVIGRSVDEDIKVYRCRECGTYINPEDPILKDRLLISVSEQEFRLIGKRPETNPAG